MFYNYKNRKDTMKEKMIEEQLEVKKQNELLLDKYDLCFDNSIFSSPNNNLNLLRPKQKYNLENLIENFFDITKYTFFLRLLRLL